MTKKAGALPWRSGLPPATDFPSGLFRQPVAEVARALLGTRLISTLGGETAVGVIVETEAYGGADDPASHAATRDGLTRRNASMFGPPCRAYVYRSYGVHWCVNVVTGDVGSPSAVLLRGLEPLEGDDVMLRHRSGRIPIAVGPGRLCEALAIDGALDGHDLREPPLWLEPGWHVGDGSVGVSGRVGVRAAADRPLRFYVLGSPGVSRRSSR